MDGFGALTLQTGYVFDVLVEAGRVRGLHRRAARHLPGGFLGRTPDQALGLCRALYAVCPQAQQIALARAMERAMGSRATPAVEAARDAMLLAEAAATHGFSLLATWPRARGLPMRAAPLAALLSAVRAHAADPGAPAMRRVRQAAAEAAEEAATLPPPPTERASGAARLPVLSAAWFAASLADPGWRDAPTVDGTPREPGPLARLGRNQPLSDAGCAARHAARLAELGAIGAGQDILDPAEDSGGGGSGTAVVDTARGPLAVSVLLRDGRIARHASLAPTEWLLHERGALHAALAGLPADATLAPRAAAVLASLDPCCACELRLDGRTIARHA